MNSILCVEETYFYVPAYSIAYSTILTIVIVYIRMYVDVNQGACSQGRLEPLKILIYMQT